MKKLTPAEAEASFRKFVASWRDPGEGSPVLDPVMAEYDRRGVALDRIAEAHSKTIDASGGSWGDCTECGWSWPCPTHVWATTDRDVLAPWNPTDDEDDDA